MGKNCRLRVKIWENFLKSPRFPTPETFLWARLNVEIYTDACAKSPFGSDSVNWDSGVWIGGILVIEGNIVEFFSLEANGGISHWLTGPKSPHRLISCFELLGTYVGIRLSTPGRLGNNDLTWLEIPIAAHNLGNDFILRGLYKSSRPTSWMLQELAAHSLTTNNRNYLETHEKRFREVVYLVGKIKQKRFPASQRINTKGPRMERPEILVYKYQRQVCDGIVMGAFS